LQLIAGCLSESGIIGDVCFAWILFIVLLLTSVFVQIAERYAINDDYDTK